MRQYYMGDFGDNAQEMGFKIKLPKLKMPEIRIGKKMQAEIFKPIATVSKVVAPAAAFIPGIGTAVAAGAAAAGAAASQIAAKAEYDLAVKKAKDQQKKMEAKIAADITAQAKADELARIEAEKRQQISQAEAQKKKSNLTTGILGVGAAAAIGAFFLLKE